MSRCDFFHFAVSALSPAELACARIYLASRLRHRVSKALDDLACGDVLSCTDRKADVCRFVRECAHEKL